MSTLVQEALVSTKADVIKEARKQAGAELGQAQAQFELLMKFKLTLQLEFTTSPGGWWWWWWVLDFTKLLRNGDSSQSVA